MERIEAIVDKLMEQITIPVPKPKKEKVEVTVVEEGDTDGESG